MSMIGRLRWYRKRLRSMSVREIAHRLLAAGRVSRLRSEQRSRWGVWPQPIRADAFSFCCGAQERLEGLKWDDGRLAGPDPTGAGQVLGHAWTWHDDPAVWHRAPDSGATWPSGFFAGIPYRAGNPHGDVRVVWEPSRLQQLVAVALASRRADDDRAHESVCWIERVLTSWVLANPPYRGVHYISAMECALRLLAVCHALDLVRGRLTEPATTWAACVNLVESHARLIERRLSLHSSAGNHTLAECAGLIYAGVLFPELARADRWRARGLALFEREIDRQLLADGGGVERSLHYSWFITDLCGLVVALLESNAGGAPAAVTAAWQRGRAFLAALASSPENLPAIGDADDGVALSPALDLSWPGNRMTAPPAVKTFEQTGYTVLRSGGARLVFDHGPLGMAPLFGHGHADALAIDLRVGDETVLADAGTFTYNGDPRWRRYFRGTRAHNTVTLAGRDQARQESAFMWSRPYRCRLIDCSQDGDRIRLLGRVHRAESTVVHWRGLVWDGRRGLMVWDHLEESVPAKHESPGAREEHRAEQDGECRWHIPLQVTPTGRGWRLGRGDVFLTVAGPGEDHWREGPSDPGPGWRAPAYGLREPIRTLERRHRGTLPWSWQTTITWGGTPSLPDWTEEIERFEGLI